MRVLLVEDNDGDADLVAEALRGTGSDVMELARVERLSAAAQKLQAERFDVVLLDLSLPDAHGLEGLQRLRMSSPTAPIVVLTGHLDTSIGVKAIQHGAQDFLQKGEVLNTNLVRTLHFARERAQYNERAQLLADVSTAIGGLLDPTVMLSALRDVLNKRFTDWNGIDGVGRSQTHELEIPSGPTPAPEPPRLLSALSALGADDAQSTRVADLLARALTSAMIVPFQLHGAEAHARGAFTFARRAASHPYGLADLALAEEITRRVVAALEYARLLEIAQRERERAEVASRVRDEFLATLSHELRTPLTSVVGWTQMLRSGRVPAARQQKAFETIERNALSQVALIEDVLDVSRIVTGKIRIHITTVDFAELVAAALESIRPASLAKGVHVELMTDSEIETVRCDRDRLIQILWNLLSNAVKFTPRGGTVTVRVWREASSVVISVTDTGLGIDAAFLPHVFERFRQGDSTITRSHGGLGLGLAISRHLTDLQGGSISAASDGANAGSTFTVRLPVAPLATREDRLPPVPAQASPKTSTGPSLEGFSILLVDDDADTRMLLTEILEGYGAVVDTAASAAEGLASLRALHPDVLVSDIGMPGASGYDLIKSVRALTAAEGASTPAVALSAYASAEDLTRALSAGFDRHLGKPVMPEDLLAAIVEMKRVRASG